MSIGKKSLILIVFILVVDQALKIWIKTSMRINEEIHVLGNWFILHFTENNGMAFGLDLPGDYGKMILSLFRMAAIAGIMVYLFYLIRIKAHNGLIISISFILAGAIGNILDSAFYGIIFSDSYGRVATLFPPEGGYSGFLHGRVVDMLYFPVIKGTLPDWFPIWGNRYIVFFRPIFNIADSSITTGVASILIWQRSFFSGRGRPTTKDAAPADTAPADAAPADATPPDTAPTDDGIPGDPVAGKGA